MTGSSPKDSSTAEAKQVPEPALLTPSTFTLGDALAKAGLPLSDTMVIRHAYIKVHKDGFPGINADSTFDQIMTFTSTQSRDPRASRRTQHASGSSSSQNSERAPVCGQWW